MNEQQYQSEVMDELKIKEFNELGKLNEHSNHDIRSIGYRKINQPAEHEPIRNFINSNDSKATPF